MREKVIMFLLCILLQTNKAPHVKEWILKDKRGRKENKQCFRDKINKLVNLRKQV